MTGSTSSLDCSPKVLYLIQSPNATVICRLHHINDFASETQVKDATMALLVFGFRRPWKAGLPEPFSELLVAIPYATIKVGTPFA